MDILDDVFTTITQRTQAKKNGTGWQGHCPGPNHKRGDQSPSLSISRGESGRILIHCFAGCEALDVCAALDLTLADLQPPRPDAVKSNGHGRDDALGPIVSEYAYGPRHRVTRHDPKTFRPWHRGANGAWVMGKGPDSWPLFQQDAIEAAGPDALVFVVEGERDVDALAALGLVATTNAGGAGKWLAAHSEALRGRRVAILPDNDKPGEAHAEKVAKALHGIAKETRIVRLPDLPERGDVSDWLNAGGTVAELLALVESAIPYAVPPKAAPGAQLKITKLSAIQPKEIDFLWHRWLARGKLHLLAGLFGEGKGTLTAWLAALGSTGGTWPDGSPAPRFRTLFVLGEDALDDTLRPRLDLHGANTDEILAIETVLDTDGKERFFNVAKHLDLLEAAIIAHRFDVLVIDPLTTVMPGSDRNAEGDTRDMLTPLMRLGERHNVAIIGVVHIGKPSGTTRTPAQRILGATAFAAMARVVWMVAPDGNGQSALGVVKSNVAIKPPALAWSRAEDAPIVWHGNAEQDIGDLLNVVGVSSPRADAEGFLRELLKGGAVDSARVEALGTAAGFSWATLRRAAGAIPVKKWKQPGVKDGRWFWMLPDGTPIVTGESDAA